MGKAAYDDIADWYAEWVTGTSEYNDLVGSLTIDLVGSPPEKPAVVADIGCGTGARTVVLQELGWTPIGFDLSAGQLRHAARQFPVAQANATALPLQSSSVSLVTAVLCHTDVPDYAAVVREAARVLRPGGRMVHIGVHPSFVGAFADRSNPAEVLVDHTYDRLGRRFDSFTPHGVRSKVGAWHLPLDSFLHCFLDAGLTLTRVQESRRPDTVPDLLGIVARK
ncbi:class I SAM-dependent methyltransferase [Catelliglobosispora koreensis]|uniref:class I SAM-dependent methyltransferase n=1 Tax=Catelliglobosispora koreensis TaxID=129052 RepID=UPI00037B5B4F|nr:class I SAM-dependent methyltransferase [Catelliglobosispora koreensis]